MDRWLGPNEDRSHDVLTGALSLTQYEAPPPVPRGSSLNTTVLIVHLCSYWSTGLLVVTRAFNIHRHISKGPSFLFGLRFRSNYHSRKHVSLRSFTSSIVRGPFAWGPWGSRGDPRIPRIPPWIRLWVECKSLKKNGQCVWRSRKNDTHTEIFTTQVGKKNLLVYNHPALAGFQTRSCGYCTLVF